MSSTHIPSILLIGAGQILLVILSFFITVLVTRWIFKINKLESKLEEITKESAQTNRLLTMLLNQKRTPGDHLTPEKQA